MASALDTRKKLQAGVEKLERQITGSPLRPDGKTHFYEGRISLKEILRLGGVKSQATIHGSHHEATKKWLDKTVERLKILGGKRKPASTQGNGAMSMKEQNDLLAQKLAAAHYEILRLKQARRDGGAKVVPFKKPR